jgi:hypothetical protein
MASNETKTNKTVFKLAFSDRNTKIETNNVQKGVVFRSTTLSEIGNNF